MRLATGPNFRRKLAQRLFRGGVELCSGLVDLVVRVGRDGGSGHRLALAGEGFVGLFAEHFAEVREGGVDVGIGRQGKRTRGRLNSLNLSDYERDVVDGALSALVHSYDEQGIAQLLFAVATYFGALL